MYHTIININIEQLWINKLIKRSDNIFRLLAEETNLNNINRDLMDEILFGNSKIQLYAKLTEVKNKIIQNFIFNIYRILLKYMLMIKYLFCWN